MLIILNPKAGRTRAVRRLAPFLKELSGSVDVVETQRAGEARFLARQAAEKGVSSIVAAGGDGTVHEVACGILETDSTDVVLGVIPIGSANDFAWSVQRQFADWDPNGIRPKLDVGRVWIPGGKSEFFIESLGTGLSGHVTIASRKIGWLQGIPLYTLATLHALWNYRGSNMELTLDDSAQSTHTMLLSILLGNREGSFLLAPHADLADGWFDVVLAREISQFGALRLLPRMAIFGTPQAHPQIDQSRCRTAQIRSDQPLAIHTDGELFAVPTDGVIEIHVELLASRLAVEIHAVPPERD